ncbi:SLATT domain-containing protein [Nonomuraea sp. NPDC001831]|uniref:SLATT domain-containing protein n=1 Tax=Nonomuraea sp. NPDC001831 TaxID=3364340 RepID=UPI0036811A94
MAGLPDDISPAIERLERRSYTTYLSRLNAYRRLAHANTAWNVALVALSTSTVIASVGMLVEKEMYGKGGDALMVALAVFSLSISLVVSSVGYGTRAKAMEENYKRIQQISVSTENLKEYTGPDRREKYQKLRDEYDVAMASSENHTEHDYRRTQSIPPRSGFGFWRRARGFFGWLRYCTAMAFPYVSLVVPVALLVPFGVWFVNGL